MQRSDGAALLRVAASGGVTRMAHLSQSDPCRVLFPHVEADEPLSAVLLVTSGGLAGGDRIRTELGVGAGAALSVTSQAAERVYRSTGADCRMHIAISVADGGTLEDVPQEMILFDASRLERRTVIDLARDAQVIAADMLVFGRTARGERFATGRLFDGWRLRRGEELVWADALALSGDVAASLDRPLTFAGANAVAMALFAGPGAAALLEPARERLEQAKCRAGVTLVNGILLARFMGRDSAAVRAELTAYLAWLRAAALSWPSRLPRVWYT